jgi:hypothetical protein
MKAKPMRLGDGTYVECSVEEATYVRLNMPGPISFRMIPVQLHGTREGTGNWSWNGDTEKPTLKPSILSRMPPVCERCHTWVNDGRAQFLDDCTHELAGQTLDLLDVE